LEFREPYEEIDPIFIDMAKTVSETFKGRVRNSRLENIAHLFMKTVTEED
jgi:hypothetical protein